jgi:Metallopeptidase family M24
MREPGSWRPTLRALADAASLGVTTAELDTLAEEEIRAAGTASSSKGYFGYPATISTSVNEQIVHGIQYQARRLRDGDIIPIDCSAIADRWQPTPWPSAWARSPRSTPPCLRRARPRCGKPAAEVTKSAIRPVNESAAEQEPEQLDT